MIEATPVATPAQAWLAHHMQNLPVYISLLAAILGGAKFWREYRRDRETEAEERGRERAALTVWRARTDDRIKACGLVLAALLLAYLCRRRPD